MSVNKVGPDTIITPEVVAAMYNDEKMSVQQIADSYRVPHSRINKFMKDNAIKRRSLSAASAYTEKIGMGGKAHTDSAKLLQREAKLGTGAGVRIKQGEDGRMAVLFTAGSYAGKSLHTFIAEHYIVNRELHPNECVHHIDGNPMNNDPCNLSVLTVNDHAHIHRLLEAKSTKSRKRDGAGRYAEKENRNVS